VLDSSDKDAVLADARGEAPEPPKSNGKDKEAEGKAEAAASGDGAIPGETKPDNKAEEHPDDVEGEDGLSARQKKEFSATMLKTIGKKHRQMKEAEEFAAAQYSERKLAEQRADHLQAALDAAKGKAAPEVKEVAKPDRQNFGTETEYVEALTDWKVDQALAKHAAEQAKQAQERAFAEMEATAKQRIADAIKLVPDFADVTGAADQVIPPAVAGYMQESEMFAELGYHLAKHPELVVSLAKLKPALQLVQIGKIESTLQPFSKEKTKDGATPSSKAVTEALQASETTGLTPSKARNMAPVIQPLSTVGAAVEKDPEDMNIRETISDWQKRNNANLAMRKRH
jgi:hypothetical protein